MPLQINLVQLKVGVTSGPICHMSVYPALCLLHITTSSDHHSQTLPSLPAAQSADFNTLNVMTDYCKPPQLILSQIMKR